MKKMILYYLFFLSLAIVLLPGCEKDPVEDPKPVTPSITTNPAADKVVPVGSDASISWESQGISKLTVKVGEEIISTQNSGSYSFTVDSEKKFEFIGFNKDNEQVASKVIRIMPQSETYPQPTIDLSASPERLPQSGSVTITWTTTNADSVFHNNVWHSPFGSISYDLTDTTTFTFLAKGKGGQVSENITICVDVVVTPPPTQEEILCSNPRTYCKEEYRYLDPGSEWIENPLSYCCQDDILTFYLNHDCTMNYGENLCQGQTETILHLPWTLENGHIFDKEITYLSSDTLVWIYPSKELLENGTLKDIEIRATYIHKP